MNAIEIQGLRKSFRSFALDDINMTLPKGYIMGLIGANGAGKTTLIRILMGLYHRDDGEVSILGLDPMKDGKRLREDIGFVFDEPKYYDFKLNKIKKIIAPFYKLWDEEQYHHYMNRFSLNGKMRFKELSRGMKLKFALAIALSHHAKLLILDEPTSGLDPVFRIELLDILQEVIEDGDKTILFSSHITSDIEKIADFITYLQLGKIIFSEDKNKLLEQYIIIQGQEKEIPTDIKNIMIHGKVTPYFYEALIPKSNQLTPHWKEEHHPTLDELMYFFEKRRISDV